MEYRLKVEICQYRRCASYVVSYLLGPTFHNLSPEMFLTPRSCQMIWDWRRSWSDSLNDKLNIELDDQFILLRCLQNCQLNLMFKYCGRCLPVISIPSPPSHCHGNPGGVGSMRWAVTDRCRRHVHPVTDVMSVRPCPGEHVRETMSERPCKNGHVRKKI